MGCHLYQEFEGHCLTASQLEQAITTLLQRHPMLHIAFRPDGQQVWLPQPYWNGVTVHDLRHNDAESRRGLSGRTAPAPEPPSLRVEIGETFDFQLTLLPDNRHRLHVNIDLLIMDASSFTLSSMSLTPCWPENRCRLSTPAMISARICCTSRRSINH